MREVFWWPQHPLLHPWLLVKKRNWNEHLSIDCKVNTRNNQYKFTCNISTQMAKQMAFMVICNMYQWNNKDLIWINLKITLLHTRYDMMTSYRLQSFNQGVQNNPYRHQETNFVTWRPKKRLKWKIQGYKDIYHITWRHFMLCISHSSLLSGNNFNWNISLKQLAMKKNHFNLFESVSLTLLHRSTV